MKRVLFVLLSVLLIVLCGCEQESSTNNPTQTTPSSNIEYPTNPFDKTGWSEYSDYELMEMTMESDQNEFRQLCAVWMTAEEWREYILENCEPFRALMLRDTALKSLEEHTVSVVEQYKDEFGGMPAENFVLLVQTVHPKMMEQLQDYKITFPPRTETDEGFVQEIPSK